MKLLSYLLLNLNGIENNCKKIKYGKKALIRKKIGEIVNEHLSENSKRSKWKFYAFLVWTCFTASSLQMFVFFVTSKTVFSLTLGLFFCQQADYFWANSGCLMYEIFARVILFYTFLSMQVEVTVRISCRKGNLNHIFKQ